MTLLSEDAITVKQAAKLLKCNVVTARRWMLHGTAQGARLESFLIGSRRLTSKQAIERFVVACNPEVANG